MLFLSKEGKGPLSNPKDSLDSQSGSTNYKTELVHKSEKIFIYRHVKIMLHHFKESHHEPLHRYTWAKL